MSALYEIADDWEYIVGLEVETEDDLEALNRLLGEVEGRFEEKAKRVAAYIRNLETDIDGHKAEEDRLATRRRNMARKVDGLKDYLKLNLNHLGLKKLDTDLFTIAVQANPPSVKILDEAKIPKDYWKPVDPVLDKKAILQTLKDGGTVEGAEIFCGDSLRIK
jgi:hypothetical protein